MKHEPEVIDASQEEAWRDRARPVVPRIAFVSGGMGGIGSAICQRFAQSGHTVVAGCLPGYERKQEWLDAMRARGFRVHAAEGDVADFDSCAEMFYNVRSVVGPVDILVNNAGITRDSVFKRMTEQDWMAVINTNLNSVFNVTRQVVDGMCERGWGRVVNISSVNALKGQFGQTNYSAAKAGMAGLRKALAQEVVKKGVTVNTVSPGLRRDRHGQGDPAGDPGPDRRRHPHGSARPPRGNRGGGGLPGLRGGGVHHGGQHLGQRRHAHDETGPSPRRQAWEQAMAKQSDRRSSPEAWAAWAKRSPPRWPTRATSSRDLFARQHEIHAEWLEEMKGRGYDFRRVPVRRGRLTIPAARRRQGADRGRRRSTCWSTTPGSRAT